MTRPDLDEALHSIFERTEYAVQVAGEAYHTPDGEDDDGRADPIHPYAAHLIAEANSLATIGLFLLAYRAATPSSNTKEIEP